MARQILRFGESTCWVVQEIQASHLTAVNARTVSYLQGIRTIAKCEKSYDVSIGSAPSGMDVMQNNGCLSSTTCLKSRKFIADKSALFLQQKTTIPKPIL